MELGLHNKTKHNSVQLQVELWRQTQKKMQHQQREDHARGETGVEMQLATKKKLWTVVRSCIRDLTFVVSTKVKGRVYLVPDITSRFKTNATLPVQTHKANSSKTNRSRGFFYKNDGL